MSAIKNPLKEWMKSEKLKAAHIASRFGVSEQTIHHWSSKGVPPTRLEFVQRTIAEWASGSAVGPRLVIQATENQFTAWNVAAMSEGKTINQWALEGLDEMAAEFEKEQAEKTAATATNATPVRGSYRDRSQDLKPGKISPILHSLPPAVLNEERTDPK